MPHKQENFKTCSEALFCSRQRDINLPENYFISDGKHEVSNKKFKLNLIRKNTKDNLINLYAAFYSEIGWRIKFEDEERYSIPKNDCVLEGNLKALKVEVLLKNNREIIVGVADQKGKMRVTLDPFLVEFLDEEDKTLVSLNEKGKLHMENDKEEKVETFKSWTDTQKKGIHSFGLDIQFKNTLHVYGIPEHASSLNLKSTRRNSENLLEPYRLYNLDVFEYELASTVALYGSIPFMLSHSPTFSAGIFWVNPTETWIDIERFQKDTESHWMSESGSFELFVLLDRDVKMIPFKYARITGTSALPPLFSIAYHQCRWNYKDEQDCREVDKLFDEHDIPYDVLWLDIEHTVGKRYFTWDKTKFPDPISLQNDLAKKHRKMVTIIDPHIKVDDAYHISSEAKQKNYFVLTKSGENLKDWCWPGDSNWIDFINPEARKWWASKFDLSSYTGSTLNLFTWNDMNEPSVFNGPEITMPKDSIHHGGIEHREIHNIYGMYQHRSTAEGLAKRNKGRPFVLSRAFFAGSQKFGAIWTGDNMAEWSHLEASVPMLLSIGLAGMSFSGADVGGFFNNPSAELTVRWYQLAAFQPFFRGHAHIETKRREPWVFGEPYTTFIKEAIKIRYSLLPYVYTLYYETHVAGLPVMRPLFMEYPKQTDLYDYEGGFFLGDSILVFSVAKEGESTVKVVLPGKEDWLDFYDGKKYKAGTHNIQTSLSLGVPTFIRAGSIIAKWERIRRASKPMQEDPFTFIIAPDSQGNAKGQHYHDDTLTFAYLNGNFIHNEITLESFSVIKSKSRKNLSKDARGVYSSPKAYSECFPYAEPTVVDKSYTRNVIERIIIWNTQKSPKTITLTDANGTTNVDFYYQPGKLIIKMKPLSISVSQEWEIKID